jgi:hypothetical protein
MKAGQALNIFDQAEVDRLIKILEYLPDFEEESKTVAYTNGFTKKDVAYRLVERIIRDKIEAAIDQPINIACGVYLKEMRPWPIHTDYHYVFDTELNPDLVIIVPLKVDGPADRTTHTIVFNEPCLTNFADYLVDAKPLDNNAKTIYNKHCSHVTEQELEYVTVNTIAPWHIGSVIYMDRALLHCSDDFLANDIIRKDALVLFTGKEKNEH